MQLHPDHKRSIMTAGKWMHKNEFANWDKERELTRTIQLSGVKKDLRSEGGLPDIVMLPAQKYERTVAAMRSARRNIAESFRTEDGKQIKEEQIIFKGTEQQPSPFKGKIFKLRRGDIYTDNNGMAYIHVSGSQNSRHVFVRVDSHSPHLKFEHDNSDHVTYSRKSQEHGHARSGSSSKLG
jgi:hypothetical protein